MQHKNVSTLIKYSGFVIFLFSLGFILQSCGGSSPGTTSTTAANINPYDYPTDITPSPDGSRLYVADNVRNAISIIDPNSLAQIGEIRTSCAPRHLVINAAGTQMYVSHDDADACTFSPLTSSSFSGSKISVVDLTTNSVSKELDVSANLSYTRGMAWNETLNRLIITNVGKNGFAFINTSTQEYDSKVTLNDGSKTIDATLTSDGLTAVIPHGGESKVSIVDVTAKAQYAGSPWNITSCTNPRNVVISPDDKYAFISCNGSATSSAADKVIVIDISNTARGSALSLGFIVVGDKPTVMRISPDGNTLLVLNYGTQVVLAIPWSQLKMGVGSVTGLTFPVGSSPSDMNIIGNTMYITDQLTSRIYKYNYTNAAQSSGTATFDATPFATFPYR